MLLATHLDPSFGLDRLEPLDPWEVLARLGASEVMYLNL